MTTTHHHRHQNQKLHHRDVRRHSLTTTSATTQSQPSHHHHHHPTQSIRPDLIQTVSNHGGSVPPHHHQASSPLHSRHFSLRLPSPTGASRATLASHTKRKKVGDVRLNRFSTSRQKTLFPVSSWCSAFPSFQFASVLSLGSDSFEQLSRARIAGRVPGPYLNNILSETG